MSVKEVTYYQAVCDVCGYVNKHGEYSAWAEPESAVEDVTYDGWTEIDVPLPDDAAKFDAIRTDANGKYRSILACQEHDGEGLSWCNTCEGDLGESDWTLSEDGKQITQKCENGHTSTITLGGEGQ